MTPELLAGSDLPFLGLHYFDERHETLFFGRDEQLRDMLGKLTGARLVTVIGSSGTGKSSLVRAAVFPALRAGFLTDLRPRWRIVTMFPGSSPIGNLASALEREFATPDLELTLRRGRLGLLEAARQCGRRDDENLLVLVDQFEEIFRYQRVAPDPAAAADEASAFVQLLLEATAAAGSAIYVIMTMRSDYLGACAQFRNLPERINTGLYLIPRMRRDHLEDAITGPAAVMGGTFTPPLVQRMLNDVGEDPDQLPVLQHALLRTWLNWKADAERPQEIGFGHYEDTGGVRDSINDHAEQIYKAFSEADRRIVEAIFKGLTERDPANLDIRRPTAAGVIAKIAGVSIDDIARVARPFRDERVAFLRPSATIDLAPDTQLDITHESLIRKWYRLGGRRNEQPRREGKNEEKETPAAAKTAIQRETIVQRGWVDEEAELRDVYRDLARRARAGAAPLIGADLNVATAWRARALPHEWALRYDDKPEAYGTVLEYIRDSEATRDRRFQRGLWLRAGATLAVLLLLIAGAMVLEGRRDATHQEALRLEAEKQRRDAEVFSEIATARQLAAQADALRDQDARPELSALLAIEAVRRAPIAEVTQSLRWPLALLRKPRWSLDAPPSPGSHAGGGKTLRFSGAGDYLAVLDSFHSVHVYRVADGREMPLPPHDPSPISMSWTGNQLHLYFIQSGGGADVTKQGVVETLTPGQTASLRGIEKPCGECEAELTRDGTRLIMNHGGAITSYPVDGSDSRSLGADVEAVDGALILRRLEQQNRGWSKTARFSLWRNGQQIGEFESEDLQPLVDLGASSSFLAVGGHRGPIRIYDKQTRIDDKQTNLALAAQVLVRGTLTALALSDDGTQLAIGSDTGDVRVISWNTGRPRAGWSHAARLARVEFSRDGKSIASLDEAGGLRVVSLDESDPGSLRAWIPLEADDRRTLDWSIDARGHFALAQGASTNAEVFDTRTGDALFEGKQPEIAALSPDGAFAAAVFSGGRLSVMDLTRKASTGFEAQLSAEPRRSLAISPNGRYVAVATEGQLRVVDTQSREPTRTLPVSASRRAAFSADGRWLALVGESDEPSRLIERPPTAVLVDCTSWTVADKWRLEGQTISSAFSADSRSLLLLARGSRRGVERQPEYQVIDLESRTPRAPYLPDGTAVTSASFSSDGALVAFATREGQQYRVRIFNAQSGAPFADRALESEPTSLAISRDRHYLGTVSSSGTIQVFALPGMDEASRMTFRDNEQASLLRFADDGQAIEILSTWTGQSDESSAQREYGIRRLRLSTNALLLDACRLATRPLSPDEWKKYLPAYKEYRDTCKELSSSKTR